MRRVFAVGLGLHPVVLCSMFVLDQSPSLAVSL
jgi:hypothetical protein